MHTFSGDAHNLSIDDKATGCFCEKLASGGGVRHMEVVCADPGKKLVLSGALGPLQGGGDGYARRHEHLGRARGFGAHRAIHAAEKPD
jgi:hypothetical protein